MSSSLPLTYFLIGDEDRNGVELDEKHTSCTYLLVSRASVEALSHSLLSSL